MKNTRYFAVLAMAVWICASFAPVSAAPSPASVFDDRSAFEALKALAGNWEGKIIGSEAHAVTHTFRVIAGGSVVLEDMFPGTPEEMVNMYHMDGSRLVLTHYCAAGNQPRMRFERTGRPGEMRFAFDGGTNLDPAKDEHMHEVTIRLGDGRIDTDWVSWKAGSKSDSSRFTLTRK